MSRSYYEILGVDRTATRDEIVHAYDALIDTYNSREYKAEVGKEAANRKLRELWDAYDTLHNSKRRAAYDVQLSNAENAELLKRLNDMQAALNAQNTAPAQAAQAPVATEAVATSKAPEPIVEASTAPKEAEKAPNTEDVRTAPVKAKNHHFWLKLAIIIGIAIVWWIVVMLLKEPTSPGEDYPLTGMMRLPTMALMNITAYAIRGGDALMNKFSDTVSGSTSGMDGSVLKEVSLQCLKFAVILAAFKIGMLIYVNPQGLSAGWFRDQLDAAADKDRNGTVTFREVLVSLPSIIGLILLTVLKVIGAGIGAIFYGILALIANPIGVIALIVIVGLFALMIGMVGSMFLPALILIFATELLYVGARHCLFQIDEDEETSLWATLLVDAIAFAAWGAVVYWLGMTGSTYLDNVLRVTTEAAGITAHEYMSLLDARAYLLMFTYTTVALPALYLNTALKNKVLYQD